MKLNAKPTPPKRKNDSVSFRTTTEKRERLEQAAIDSGMTLSTFLDAVTDERMIDLKSRLAQMQRPVPQPRYRKLPPDLIEQFVRMGNNFNQVAHAVNSDLPPQLRNAALVMKGIMDLIIENDLSPNPDAARQMSELLAQTMEARSPPARPARTPNRAPPPIPEPNFSAYDASQTTPPYGEFSPKVPLRHQRPWKTDKK
jgi:mobilization protein NikA